MPRFRLDETRAVPRPDRRLGIKLEQPASKRQLGGKLDAYVPPELRYEYKPPSVFAQYKVLTSVFVAIGLGLLLLWAFVLEHPSTVAPTPSAPAATPAQAAPGTPAAPPPRDQPIYIQPVEPRS